MGPEPAQKKGGLIYLIENRSVPVLLEIAMYAEHGAASPVLGT